MCKCANENAVPDFLPTGSSLKPDVITSSVEEDMCDTARLENVRRTSYNYAFSSAHLLIRTFSHLYASSIFSARFFLLP